MHTSQKRFLTLALASLLLLVSCGESAVNDSGETSPAAGTSTPSEVSSTPEESAAEEEVEVDYINVLASTYNDDIKKELGLDGYKSVLLLRDTGSMWSNPDIIAEETTGDRLNDAVYNRNEYLRNTFGFTLEAQYSSGDGNELKTAYTAGDSTYDFAFPQARAAAGMAQSGVLLDLAKVNYLDLENPTWSQMFVNMLTYKGKLFYATGDISVNTYEAVRGLLFNKQIRVDNNLDDPYSLVREGEWTLDAFDTMCRSSHLDLDGDGAMTTKDQWGMAWQSAKGGIVFYYGSGEHLTEIGEDQVPVLSVGTERSYDVFAKVRDMISDNTAYYQGGDQEILDIFREGRSLFMTEVLYHANSMRQSDIEFGILPMPKYDTAQEYYIQCADGYCVSPAVIPATTANADRSGFIVEALAEASCTMIKPEYYEVILKSKLSRDEESGEMLDIIYKNFVIDNADIYQWGGLENSLSTAMNNGKDLASALASSTKLLTKAMDKTFKAFDEAGQ